MEIENLKKRQKEIADKIYAISTGAEEPKPMEDGIINVEKYLTAKYKILWIMKEAYDDDRAEKGKMGGWSLCELYNRCNRNNFVKDERGKRVSRGIRQLKISHLILSNLPDDVEAFKSTAVIEIKKIPNGMTKGRRGKYANPDELQKAYNDHKDILLEQISTYNPDVVVCGNTLQYFSSDLDYKNGVKTPIKVFGNRNYYCLKNRLYINAYHPSYYKISDKEYITAVYNAFVDWRDNYRGKNLPAGLNAEEYQHDNN
jgi:hypothetical protein